MYQCYQYYQFFLYEPSVIVKYVHSRALIKRALSEIIFQSV